MLVRKLHEIKKHSRGTSYNIATYLLNSNINVGNKTLNEISKETFTSQSSLVRFAQKLGYSGWRSFIVDFMEISFQHKSKNINYNFPFLSDDSEISIIASITDLMVESIYDTSKLVNINDINTAVTIMLKSQHIVVFGLSPNSSLASVFAEKMNSIGTNVEVVSFEKAGTVANRLTSNDSAILVSYSGNNLEREPMRHLKSLIENNVPIIGITRNTDNNLRKLSDITLTILSKETLYSKIASYSVETSLHYIFNLLFSLYFSEEYESNFKYKEKMSQRLQKMRKG